MDSAETLTSWIGELHEKAGSPSVRTIEAAVGISRTTVADALKGRNSPTLETVLAVVTYLSNHALLTPPLPRTVLGIKTRRLYAMERHRAAAARTDHRRRPGRRPTVGPTVFLLLQPAGDQLVVHSAASDADEAKTKAELIHGVAIELQAAFDFREQDPDPETKETP